MTTPKHLQAENLGYQIHTNRELGLMLRGEKPLAAFMDIEGFFSQCVLRYLRMFDRHVAAGRFIKRTYRTDVEIKGVRHASVAIFYALPSQEWRIDAMRELRNQPSAWTDEDTRREGELLGYTEEQNLIWLARVKEWRR